MALFKTTKKSLAAAELVNHKEDSFEVKSETLDQLLE